MLYVKQAVTSMLFWNFHVKSIGMGTPTMYSEGCLQKPWVYRHSWFTLCEFQVSRWCTAKVNLLTNIFLCKKDCSPRALSLHSCSSYCWRASKRCHTSPHPHPLIKALYMSKIQFSGIQKHFFFFSFFLGGRGVWPFLPFIRSGQNHLARHSERGKKTRQTDRKRWEDSIREWTGLEFAKSQRAMKNREKWRKLFAKSSVVPQRPRGSGIGEGESEESFSLFLI